MYCTKCYKNTTEIYLSKRVLKRMYGLGTPALSTAATGGAVGKARSGIRIDDSENPDEVYDMVKELVRK